MKLKQLKLSIISKKRNGFRKYIEYTVHMGSLNRIIHQVKNFKIT